jgi:hypothetical protein
VHVNENMVIVSKIVFYLVVNIVRNINKFLRNLLYIEMAMYQCIIFHHALCHHALCYIININPMVHMYILCKEGWGNFHNDYMDRSFINKHLNVCLLYYNC